MTNELIKRNNMENIASAAGTGLGAATGYAIAQATATKIGLSAFGYALSFGTAASPAGWLFGGAIVGGLLLKYGSKIIGLKGKSDGINKIIEDRLDERQKIRIQEIGAKLAQADINIAIDLWTKILDQNIFDSAVVNNIMNGLKDGTVTHNEAIELACEALDLNISEYLTHNQVTINELMLISYMALIMMLQNGEIEDEEQKVFFDIFQQLYNLNEEDAEFILIKALDDIDVMFNNAGNKKIDLRIILLCFAECFASNIHLHKQILTMLEAIGKADGCFDDDEMYIYDFTSRVFNMASKIKDCQDLLANLPIDDPSVYLYDHKKFPKKVQNAIDSYAFGLLESQIIALYDSTFFGKADEGFVLTTTAIIDDSSNIIFYDEIKKVSINDEKNSLTIHTPSGKVDFNCYVYNKSEIINFLNTFHSIN